MPANTVEWFKKKIIQDPISKITGSSLATQLLRIHNGSDLHYHVTLNYVYSILI
jgi:hypothetical protein